MLLATASAALVVRYTPIPNHRVLYLVIASPFLVLAAPVAVVVLCWGRRWILAVVAALLTVALVALQLPSYLGSTPDSPSATVRVMTINTFYGRAEPSAIARAAEHNADILLTQELTPRGRGQPFRRLLTNGYQDAARQAGSGRNLTYPANKRYPPVLGIDHVLTRNAIAVSTPS